MKFLH